MNTDTIVEVKDLSKSYGKIKAVNGVSFDVYRGEIFGLLGPNGAGKTTTLEILEGLTSPDGGSASVVGFDVVKSPNSVKAHIGIQLQSSAFFPKLKLRETLSLYGRLYGFKIDPKKLLGAVDLQDKAGAYFGQLSGGQKQRFSIAVGLVNNPDLIFLDEPTTGLDPGARRLLWDLIKQFKSRGQSILMTTHYMEEAEELCDRIGIMDQGKIIALDTSDNLIDSLLKSGFKSSHKMREATLEDVFIDFTGKKLH